MLSDFGGNLSGQALLPSMDSANRLQKFLSQHALQQVTPGPGFDSARDLEIPGMGCQDDNSSFGELAANRADGVDTAHLWHLQIHERDVRMMLSKLFERLSAVSSFPEPTACPIGSRSTQRCPRVAVDGRLLRELESRLIPLSLETVANVTASATYRKRGRQECSIQFLYRFRI